jgi:Uma2 family endonuclease
MTAITSLSQLDLNGTYTYADYLTWKFDEMVELIKGKIFKMAPAPKDIHQSISKDILADLLYFLKPKKCQARFAPSDVRLFKTVNEPVNKIETVVQPDIYVVCDPSKLDEQGCNGAPDWIIEILSPSTLAHDYKTKYDLYEENGVLEYWIVNPKTKVIERFVLNNDKYEDAGVYKVKGEQIPNSIFTDFVLNYDDVFRD